MLEYFLWKIYVYISDLNDHLINIKFFGKNIPKINVHKYWFVFSTANKIHVHYVLVGFKICIHTHQSESSDIHNTQSKASQNSYTINYNFGLNDHLIKYTCKKS